MKDLLALNTVLLRKAYQNEARELAILQCRSFAEKDPSQELALTDATVERWQNALNDCKNLIYVCETQTNAANNNSVQSKVTHNSLLGFMCSSPCGQRYIIDRLHTIRAHIPTGRLLLQKAVADAYNNNSEEIWLVAPYEKSKDWYKALGFIEYEENEMAVAKEGFPTLLRNLALT